MTEVLYIYIYIYIYIPLLIIALIQLLRDRVTVVSLIISAEYRMCKLCKMCKLYKIVVALTMLVIHVSPAPHLPFAPKNLKGHFFYIS